MSPGTVQTALAGGGSAPSFAAPPPAALAVQVRAAVAPDDLAVDRRLGEQLELRAALVRREVRRPHAQVERLVGATGRSCSIRLPTCTRPSGENGNAAAAIRSIASGKARTCG